MKERRGVLKNTSGGTYILQYPFGEDRSFAGGNTKDHLY